MLATDPPHEPKGWYSVYDADTTVRIIKDHCSRMAQQRQQDEKQ